YRVTLRLDHVTWRLQALTVSEGKGGAVMWLS
ncbi:hypothetical protein MTO96_042773, partial [Rhipicephalus appendiculatus]